jgi:hypothetical protein
MARSYGSGGGWIDASGHATFFSVTTSPCDNLFAGLKNSLSSVDGVQ